MRVLAMILVILAAAAVLIPVSIAAAAADQTCLVGGTAILSAPVIADTAAGSSEQAESAALSADDLADKEDGIDLKAATAWIVIVAALLFTAIISVTVMLGLRNRNNGK